MSKGYYDAYIYTHNWSCAPFLIGFWFHWEKGIGAGACEAEGIKRIGQEKRDVVTICPLGEMFIIVIGRLYKLNIMVWSYHTY